MEKCTKCGVLVAPEEPVFRQEAGCVCGSCLLLESITDPALTRLVKPAAERFYDLSGKPVRRLSGASSPEIYQGGGRWKHLADVDYLKKHGQRITKAQFDVMVRSMDEQETLQSTR